MLRKGPGVRIVPVYVYTHPARASDQVATCSLINAAAKNCQSLPPNILNYLHPPALNRPLTSPCRKSTHWWHPHRATAQQSSVGRNRVSWPPHQLRSMVGLRTTPTATPAVMEAIYCAATTVQPPSTSTVGECHTIFSTKPRTSLTSWLWLKYYSLLTTHPLSSNFPSTLQFPPPIPPPILPPHNSDPPVDPKNIPSGEWLCRRCNGLEPAEDCPPLFRPLLDQAYGTNPLIFNIPDELKKHDLLPGQSKKHLHRRSKVEERESGHRLCFACSK